MYWLRCIHPEYFVFVWFLCVKYKTLAPFLSWTFYSVRIPLLPLPSLPETQEAASFYSKICALNCKLAVLNCLDAYSSSSSVTGDDGMKTTSSKWIVSRK